MSRNLEVAKILKHVQETKMINFDVPIRAVTDSELISVISASDEPWELICYTWVVNIHRGSINSIDEITVIADSIAESIGSAVRAVQRGE